MFKIYPKRLANYSNLAYLCINVLILIEYGEKQYYHGKKKK